MGKVREVTDSTFAQEVLPSKIPVLVDVWADWCGPCKAIAPIVEALASQYGGQLKVMNLDVDKNPRPCWSSKTASRPSASSVPCRST